MKRRLTKRAIRLWERALAEEAVKCLARWNQADIEARKEIRFSLRVWLISLLSDRLRLDAEWPHKERWLDEISILSVRALEPDSVVVTGKLWWGLSQDIGGMQWREPLKATIRLTKRRKHRISYEIVFGKRGKRHCHSNWIYGRLDQDHRTDPL